eukprot:9996257-Ditylum_brightwellii.AAC.1
MLLCVSSATCVALWFSRTGGGGLCLHMFVPGLQVVVLGGERCNVIDGLALLGGVFLVRGGWNQPVLCCEED